MRITRCLCFLLLVWLPNVVVSLRDKGASYYDILGVSRTAKPKEIKKAYLSKSKEHHPDVSDAPDAKEKFQEVAEAYEILSDEETKQIYDKYGKEGIEKHRSNQGSGGGAPADPFDILRSFGFGGDFFGGGRGSGRRQQRPKHETEIPFFLSLEQMYNGTDQELEVDIQRLCLKHKKCVTEDKECAGPGVKLRTMVSMGGSQIVQQRMEDPGCSDAGYRVNKNCSHCPDGLYEKKIQRIFITIPPGTSEGQKFRFPDVGREDIGQERGDVVITVFQLPHPIYKRDNNDLHVDITITLGDALGGFEAELPSPDGVKENSVKVVRDRPVAHGETQIIQGRGMLNSQGNRGNLVIKYLVTFPQSLSQKDAKELKTILNRTTQTKASVC